MSMQSLSAKHVKRTAQDMPERLLVGKLNLVHDARLLMIPALSTSAGKCLSLDHTIKVANKATIVNPQKQRLHLIRALLSVINEYTEIMNWVRTVPAL